MRQPTLEDRIMKVWNVVDLLKDSLELDDEDEFRTTIAGLHNLAEQSMEKLFESFEASLQPTVANVSTLAFEPTPEAAAKAIPETEEVYYLWLRDEVSWVGIREQHEFIERAKKYLRDKGYWADGLKLRELKKLTLDNAYAP